MASVNKKTRTVYNLELNEEEMKVLANVLYRVQLSRTGPGSITSDIYSEVEKYCYVDEYDPEGRPNWIPTYEDVSGAIYWNKPPEWSL